VRVFEFASEAGQASFTEQHAFLGFLVPRAGTVEIGEELLHTTGGRLEVVVRLKVDGEVFLLGSTPWFPEKKRDCYRSTHSHNGHSG